MATSVVHSLKVLLLACLGSDSFLCPCILFHNMVYQSVSKSLVGQNLSMITPDVFIPSDDSPIIYNWNFHWFNWFRDS